VVKETRVFAVGCRRRGQPVQTVAAGSYAGCGLASDDFSTFGDCTAWPRRRVTQNHPVLTMTTTNTGFQVARAVITHGFRLTTMDEPENLSESERTRLAIQPRSAPIAGSSPRHALVIGTSVLSGDFLDDQAAAVAGDCNLGCRSLERHPGREDRGSDADDRLAVFKAKGPPSTTCEVGPFVLDTYGLPAALPQ
jgi:hypothetical protein